MGAFKASFSVSFHSVYPQHHDCCPSPSLSLHGMAGRRAGSQADEEPDPQPPPGLPTEAEHLRANIQGQSINGDTGSPSLPGQDAQCNVPNPVCEGTAPRRNSRAPQSKAHGEQECGCLFSQGLNKPDAGDCSCSPPHLPLPLAFSLAPPFSLICAHTYTTSHTCTLLHPHTSIST